MKTLITHIFVLILCGCTSYKGGKIVDGMNIEVGMTVPGTQFTINFLSYTSGVVVKGNDNTSITVTHSVAESNSFFGVVHTFRNTELTAEITPTIAE